MCSVSVTAGDKGWSLCSSSSYMMMSSEEICIFISVLSKCIQPENIWMYNLQPPLTIKSLRTSLWLSWIPNIFQTSQVSGFGRKTHTLQAALTLTRHTWHFSRWQVMSPDTGHIQTGHIQYTVKKKNFQKGPCLVQRAKCRCYSTT